MFGGGTLSFNGSAGASAVGDPGNLAGGMVVNRASQGNSNSSSLGYAPWIFLILAGLYIVWAMVEQHQRVQETVSPSNIAINLRDVLLVTFTAILGIVGLKILFTKLVAFGVPGAATINQIIAAV